MRRSDRITVEDLRHYVPIFQQADHAMDLLLEEDLDPHERNRLESVARMRSIAISRISDLCAPLIVKEVASIIKSSRIPISQDPTIFDTVYQAGIGGMIRGLRKFNVDKINVSSTNYLLQWITTYSKKEMLSLETPEGIAPSRYQKMKKIAAVRSKLSSERGREVSNEEVLEYFHSGSADIENKNGRVGSSDVAYESNKKMTIDLIEEQEALYKGDMGVVSIDTQDTVSTGSFSDHDSEILGESLFGRFLETGDFTDQAKSVLLSEMNVPSMGDYLLNVVSTMTPSEYRSLATVWKKYLRDPHSLFFSFLKDLEKDPHEEFHVGALISRIEQESETRNTNYSKLFNKGAK